MKFNAISTNFPLSNSYSNLSPQKEKEQKPCLKLFPEIKNGYNNEAPTFLKIDSMRENKKAYHNRYLNEFKDEDRCSFLKSFEQEVKTQVKVIGEIKKNKLLSDNPADYSNYFLSSKSLDLQKKRQNHIHCRSTNNVTKKLDEETVNVLKNYSPKFSYLLKHTLDKSTKDVPLTTLTKRNHPFSSGYLKNSGDFSIKESYLERHDDHNKMKKMDAKVYNCLLDSYDNLRQDSVRQNNWGGFYEK